MARSTGRHRDPRDGGSSSSGRVVMVSQRSGGTAETRAREKKRDNKKKTPIAGRMWDSFESESPSEEEEEEDDDDAQQPSHTTSRSVSSTTSERRDRRARKDRPESDRSKGEVEKKGKMSGSHGGSSGGGSHSAGSSTNTKRSSRATIRVGDKVVVYLRSGGKGKGTVSAESSRDRYEVTLDNGDVEKRVHSRNIALAGRHRQNKHRKRDGDRTRTSTSGSQQKKGSPRRQEPPHEALEDRQGSSIHDALLSESGSQTPRDHHSGSSPRDSSQSASSGNVGSLPPSSSAGAHNKDNNTVGGGNRPSSPVSQGLSTMASDAASGGGDPAEQPPDVESHSPDTAPAAGQPPLTPIEAPVSESEPDTSNGEERGSSSGRRSSSPLSSKVRQAQGLLKTMFWKKGEEQGGGSVQQRERSASRSSSSSRWPGGDSISRRFSKGSGGPEADEGLRRHAPPPPPDKEDEGEGSDNLDPPTPTSARSGGDDAASTPLGAAALKGHARRLSQGLMTRGRSRSRKKSEAGHGGAASGSSPAASRSPSLAAKLGMTLRGAVMGTTQLGVHKPHVGRRTPAEGNSPRSAGSDADGAASDATYSTGASTKEKLSRRERRKPSAAGRAEDHGGHAAASDGFDSDDIFGQGSPLAPATYGGDPRNFPDAVHSYIGARERMEQEMSASGPAFLPSVDSLAANSAADGAIKGWGRRRGSLDITKQASSTTQRTEQHQPFTEAMFKAGISETKHSTKQGILLEGDLQKFSPESMRGVRWHKRYFVLYACSCELRYYRTHAEAAWGRIPLGERGSIPLRLVVKIEQPSDKKYRGCRFDLVVLHRGDSRHPGLNIRPGHESRVFTTKTFKLNAADAQQRLLWVTVIEALMKKHGWGVEDADRCRSPGGAPRHGGPGADAGDSLYWGGSTWDGEAAGSEPAGRQAPPTRRLDHGRSKINTGALEDEFSSPRTTGLGHHGVREGVVGKNSAARRGSVMNFVKEQDDRQHPGSLRQHGHDGTFTATPAHQQQRGLSIPYSPGGKRGSLTTGALSPPVITSGGGFRRQTSLKSDLRL